MQPACNEASWRCSTDTTTRRIVDYAVGYAKDDLTDAAFTSTVNHVVDSIPGLLAAGEIAHSSGLDVLIAAALAYELLGGLGVHRWGALSMTKGASTAFAVRNGLFCALLARGGFTSAPEPVEGYYGLAAALGDFEPRLPFMLASALLDGDISLNSYRPERFNDPAVRGLMAKMTVTSDEEFTKIRVVQEGVMRAHPLRVTFTTRSGATMTEELRYHKGHYRDPLTKADLDVKFDKACQGTVGPAQRDQIRQAWWTWPAPATLPNRWHCSPTSTRPLSTE